MVLLLLSVAAGTVLFSFFNSTKVTFENDQKTADALAAAKAALIGYALRGQDGGTNPQRPGEFPCPDTNNDGFQDGTCVAGRLGRIPWKTLGIPEPKDAAGETLWYAIAGPFRSFNGGALNNNPINSDTRGNITVYAADGTTLLTTQAVAVVFAPGQALDGQNRDPNTAAACTTSPASPVPLNRCAANYLETSVSINNATTNGPFINGQRSPIYNDRVIFITTQELIPLVEQRVGRELRNIIQAYYNNPINRYFPFAAAYDDASGNCALNLRRGRLPLSITAAPNAPNGTCDHLAEWPVCPAENCLPVWFGLNQWNKVMYYSVAAGYVHDGPRSCTGGCLTVGTNAAVPALFFTPGTPRTGITRPSNLLGDYLEDPQNQDGWSAGANDIYVTPTATSLDRDRIYTLLAPTAPSGHCEEWGKRLRSLAPCGQPPRINPECVALAGSPGPPPTGLAACTPVCANAAQVIITPPCENTLHPPVCKSARETLEEC